MGVQAFDKPLVQKYTSTDVEKALARNIDYVRREEAALFVTKHLAEGSIIRGSLPSSVATRRYEKCDYCSCYVRPEEIKYGRCPNCGAPIMREVLT